MAKKGLGREKINVIESFPYSQLIFIIASGKNYALSIAEARGKNDSSSTAKQLNQLKDRGFLNQHKEKLLNKTIYSINLEKINKEFVNYLITKSLNPSFKIPEKYIKNKYLSRYFKNIFASYEQLKIKTIREVFDNFAGALLESLAPFSNYSKPIELGEFYEILELINPANWENRRFINKSEKILKDFGNEVDMEATRKSLKNSSEVAKSTENKHILSGNTNQNEDISSEEGVKHK